MAKKSPIFKMKETEGMDYFSNNSKNNKPIFKGRTGRLINTDPSKNPSFTSRNLDFSEKSKVHKQAFKLLAESSKNSVDALGTVMTSLDLRGDKTDFIKACYDIERSGSNPVMHPRPRVMEYLRNAMLDLGIKSGISSVSAEAPILGNKKPLRFAL